MNHAESAFRKLREVWFIQHLKSYRNPYEDESLDKADLRELHNTQMKERYDKQTDEIILGHDFCIAPRCHNDLYI